ncbi:8233_t:CDS:1, partial [Gigaspora margarita]
FSQESKYRDVNQDPPGTETKTSDDSTSCNQSKQESQDTSCKPDSSDNHESPVWPYFNKEIEDIPICKI